MALSFSHTTSTREYKFWLYIDKMSMPSSAGTSVEETQPLFSKVWDSILQFVASELDYHPSKDWSSKPRKYYTTTDTLCTVKENALQKHPGNLPLISECRSKVCSSRWLDILCLASNGTLNRQWLHCTASVHWHGNASCITHRLQLTWKRRQHKLEMPMAPMGMPDTVHQAALFSSLSL